MAQRLCLVRWERRYVRVCALERSVGPNGVVKTRTLTVFRGHLNFDHGDICRMEPESTNGVGFSYYLSCSV